MAASLLAQNVQLRWQRDLLADGKLPQGFVLVPQGIDLVAHSVRLLVHLLHVAPLLRLFRLQLVLLLDPFDPAARGVSTVLERAPPLLHPDDLIPGQATQLQGTVQVSDRNRHQLVVADVRDGARR